MLTTEAAPATGAGPAFVWTRVVPAPGRTDGTVERAGWLDPYTAGTIAEDALHAGRGARLEFTVPTAFSDWSLRRLRSDFAWLGARGIEVTVRRRASTRD